MVKLVVSNNREALRDGILFSLMRIRLRSIILGCGYKYYTRVVQLNNCVVYLGLIRNEFMASSFALIVASR